MRGSRASRRGSPAQLLEFALFAVVTGLLVGLMVGVALAVLGWFHWLGVALTGVVAGSLALARGSHRIDPAQSQAMSGSTAIVAALVIVALSVLSVWNPGEHLWNGRDAGTYVTTASWLADTGGLLVEARVGPFADEANLEFAVSGFYERPDGRLSPQFFHAFPVVLAAVDQPLGLRAMLSVNAVIGALGLFSVFALALRIAGPIPALLAVLLLGLNPVFVYFTRAPFSEPLALVFITTGFWLMSARKDDDAVLGLIAGALLGAAVMARVDSLLVVIPLLGLVLFGAHEQRHSFRTVLRGFIVVAGFGLAEVVLVSPWYIGQLDAELLLIGIGVLGVGAVGVFGRSVVVRVASWIREERRLAANLMTTAIVGALLFATFLRPRLGTAVGSVYGLAPIQEVNGLPIEPTRTYAELSVHWLLWYLGPAALALGFAGLVQMVRRLFTSPVAPPTLFWLSTAALFIGAYLWRPSINPDHIWAMRRFLPVVLPALAIGAGIAVQAIAGWHIPMRKLVAAAAMLSSVAGVAVGFTDVWNLHELEGLSEDFRAVCADVGDDAAVLMVDSTEAERSPFMMQGFRSFCSLPVAAVDSAWFGSDDLQRLDSSWEKQQRRLVLVGAPSVIADLSVDTTGGGFQRQYPLLEYTLTRRPVALVAVENRVVLSRLR